MGAFVSSVGQSSSQPCPPGTFQYVGGSSSCTACSQGTYQSKQGSTSCSICQPGSYSDAPGLSVCLACPPGSAAPLSGSSTCTPCLSGSFQSASGAVQCQACFQGLFQSKVGQAECLLCAQGKFQSEQGASSCLSCGKGTYQVSAGATVCLACQTGTFSKDWGAVSPSSCTPCAGGAYSPTPAATSCHLCQAGHHAPLTGATVCVQCSAGYYQPQAGSTGCLACAAGTFSTSWGALEQDACLRCRAGTYSTGVGMGAGLDCVQCSPGRFSTALGASANQSCQECPRGTISAHDGAHCLACADGTVCASGSRQPVLCLDERLVCNGTHLMAVPGSLPVLEEGCTAAIQCPPGSQCSKGDPSMQGVITLPEELQLPYFVVFKGGSEQTPTSCLDRVFSYGHARVDSAALPEGQWNKSILFYLMPLRCPCGTFLQGGSCAACLPGTFSAMLGAFDSSVCTPCLSGTFMSTLGASTCHACARGTYQTAPQATFCEECQYGRFQSADQSTGCSMCAKGTYNYQTGVSACSPCDAGTFQSGLGTTACLACGPGNFSSAGDYQCTACGVAISGLGDDHLLACPALDRLPADATGFYLSVRGETESDTCMGIGLSRYQGPVRAGLVLPVHPLLHQDVRCEHTLHVMGTPRLQQVWVTSQRIVRRASKLRVIPHGEHFNLALCGLEGLGVSFVLEDAKGHQDTDLAGAEGTLALVAPQGKNLLYWSSCDMLPWKVAGTSGIHVGQCITRNFCPTMDVIARVTVAWPGGFTLQGEHTLRVEKPSLCPPSSAWMASVELEVPGMRYFQHDQVNILVRITGAPQRLTSIRFQLAILRGFDFVSVNSNFSFSQSMENRILSVECDLTRHHHVGSEDFVGARLTLQVSNERSGTVPAVRAASDSFSSTTDGNVSFSMPVRMQGFVCGRNGVLYILVHPHQISALVARPTLPALVNWGGIQKALNSPIASVEAVGFWNKLGEISVVTNLQCSLVPLQGLLTLASCSFIQALNRQGRSGVADVRVRAGAAKTVVSIPVFLPANLTSRVIPGLDGVSGRFKILARLQLGLVQDYFGSELDITPYLKKGMQGDGALVRGEEWICDDAGREAGFFTVGNPVLIQGACSAQAVIPEKSTKFIPFLFTGGRTSVGGFVFSPSLLHPLTPSGTLLFFAPTNGLPLPEQFRNDFYSFDLLAGEGRIKIHDQDGKLSLMGLGMSPRCVRLIETADWAVPVLPASPASLEVALSTRVLVSQHDVWGLLPSSASLVEASLVLTDGTRLSMLEDPRLRFNTTGDLDLSPDFNVHSRSLSGNFTVFFSLVGIPCLTTGVTVQVFPYSMRSAKLVCSSCPRYLTLRDDPMSIHDPLQYPSLIPLSFFKTRYQLMDGSMMDKLANIRLKGPGILVLDGVIGVGAGVITVAAEESHEALEITVISRWLTHFEPLCNGQACFTHGPGIKLTPPGDGAGQAPFSYSPGLAVTLRLTLFNGSQLASSLLHGMRLEADGKQVPSPDSVPLKFGSLELEVIPWDERYNLASRKGRLFVHRLEKLEISGPSVLFQIHCARVWEQASYQTSALLSDGEKADIFAAPMTSDGQVLLQGSSAGTFWARQAGEGWITASVGNITSFFRVLATRSSKYFTSVSLPALPAIWTAKASEPFSIMPRLIPVFEVQSLQESLIPQRVLRWSASVSGVVRFSDDWRHMSLLSDYPGSIQVFCILRACMEAGAVVQSHEMRVNLLASRSAQPDLGAEIGAPLPPVEVGSVLLIPVYLFAEARLRAYSVRVVLDNVALVPLDCSRGEMVQSVCRISPVGFEAQANFSSSHRTGRVLVATVMGRAMLDTVSQIYVTVMTAWIGEQVFSPRTFRFAVRLGTDASVALGHIPHLNLEDPLLVPPQLAQFLGEDDPTILDVCCDTIVAAPSAGLSHRFASVMTLERITLMPGNVSLVPLDPRLQLLYDDSLLSFREISVNTWGWTVQADASWASSVPIEVIYTHPGTLSTVKGRVAVWLARAESLHLVPSGHLELRRVHCSQGIFQEARVGGELRLSHGLDLVLPLVREDISEVREDPAPSGVIVQVGGISLDGGVTVRGLKPGETRMLFRTWSRLEASIRILVLGESVVFESIRLPDPVVLQACRGQEASIPLLGYLTGSDTPLDRLDRFFWPLVNADGPIMVQNGSLTAAVHGNTDEGGSSARLTIRMPACSGAPEIVVQSVLRTRLVACLDEYHQVADVEIDQRQDGVELTLVGKGIISFFVHLQVDLADVTCQPLPPVHGCFMTLDGSVLMVGLANEPFDRAPIAVITPRVHTLWGFVEVFSGVSAMPVAIVAGRLGNGPITDPVKTLMPHLPVVNTAVLARARRDDTQFLMDLMLDRQRLVDYRFYSHEHELSLMFRVTDRFLITDTNFTEIEVFLAPTTPELPLLPEAARLPGGGQRAPALHVRDGWYAVQWQGFVPHLWLRLSFHVQTTSWHTHQQSEPKVWDLSGQPFEIGGKFHECPRAAVYDASILLTYRVYLKHQSFEWIARQLVCRLHVVRRRIQLTSLNASSGWGIVSIALESFIRVGQIRDEMSSVWFDALVRTPPPPGYALAITGSKISSWRHRALQMSQASIVDLQGINYVNDTADHAAPCPEGMYFSRNGSYTPLPMHSIAGQDCFGVVCVQGYRLQDQHCVPVEVPLDVVWICIIVIASVVGLVACLLCCVKLARMGRGVDLPPPFAEPDACEQEKRSLSLVMSKEAPGDGILMNVGTARNPFEDAIQEGDWGCHSLSEVQLDDYSSELLDDVMNSPVALGEFRR